MTKIKCNHCHDILEVEMDIKISESPWARCDAYGIFTGIYCDKCFDDPKCYPYRKDEYEHDEPLDYPNGNFFDEDE